ncbi:MAG: hypothetical protein WBD02_05435 [Acidimicrobiia bacterium]
MISGQGTLGSDFSELAYWNQLTLMLSGDLSMILAIPYWLAGQPVSVVESPAAAIVVMIVFFILTSQIPS